MPDNDRNAGKSSAWHDPLDDLISPILRHDESANSASQSIGSVTPNMSRHDPLDDLLTESAPTHSSDVAPKIRDDHLSRGSRDSNDRPLSEPAKQSKAKTEAAKLAAHWPTDEAGRAGAAGQSPKLPIGGWLNLVAAGLVFGCVVSPIRIYLNISIAMVGKLESEYPGINELLVGETAVEVALWMFRVVLTVVFFKRHRAVPRLMVLWLSSSLLASIVMLVWTKQVFGEWVDPAKSVAAVVVSVIWISYFQLSKRVKHTFGNDPFSNCNEGELVLLTDADVVTSGANGVRPIATDQGSRQLKGHFEWRFCGLIGVVLFGALAIGIIIGQGFGARNGRTADDSPVHEFAATQPTTTDATSNSESSTIAPYGTWPPLVEKQSQDSLTETVSRKVDQLQKDSNVQIRPDRAKRAMAFSFYELGIEALRIAYDSPGIEDADSDRLSKIAGEQLNRAAETDPTFSAPVIALACIELYDKNGHARAKELLNQVISREPANAEAHYYLADVYHDDGDDDQAFLSLQRAIQFDPIFAPAYSLRAVLYRNRREFAKAKADRETFDNLAGSPNDENITGTYPWTVRSILFQSKRTPLSLRYSSIWFPFESVAKGTELRLIRHSERKNIAISFINLAEMGIGDGDALDLLSEALTGIKDEQQRLSDESDFSATRPNGDRIGSHQLAWADIKTTKPPALNQRSRLFLLKSRRNAWLVRFSVPAGDESFFQQHLASAEEVIRSISFRDGQPK